MPVAQGHESAEVLFWEGRRALDVDQTVIWMRLVAVESQILPKFLSKWAVKDNVFARLLCLVADFTHRAIHYGFATKIYTALHPSMDEQPHEELHSWWRVAIPNKLGC